MSQTNELKENILITGATGNVGKEVVRYFQPGHHQALYLATRHFQDQPAGSLYFDLEDLENTKATLDQIDVLFLLRPPRLANINKVFKPFIDDVVQAGVSHIIFLSVQGADNVDFIPHAKIEKLIIESGVDYTFIRPSYFMQNLTTTLLKDIKEHDRIYLPAGNTRFLWVDVADIGKSVAAILKNVSRHRQKAYTITGTELYNFHQVSDMLTTVVGRAIRFVSPNLLRFTMTKFREHSIGYIMVLIMLHYGPRFQAVPPVSRDVEMLTGEKPGTLEAFIERHKMMF